MVARGMSFSVSSCANSTTVNFYPTHWLIFTGHIVNRNTGFIDEIITELNFDVELGELRSGICLFYCVTSVIIQWVFQVFVD